MSPAPVTLIIGNHHIAETTALKAKERGDETILALCNASSSVQHHSFELHNYDTYVSLFHTVLQAHPGIDNVILIFCPSNTVHADDHIPGSDTSTLDDVVHPLMMAVKNVWFHWRRDDRYSGGKDNRKLTLLGAHGHDAETSAASNAILGFWRSILVRTNIIGPSTDFVLSDLEDEANKDVTIRALLAPRSAEPSVHIIQKGKTTTQSSLVGQCSSLSIQSLRARLIPLMWLKEKTVKLSVRLGRLLNPPTSAPLPTKFNALALRSLPVVISVYLALSSYYAQRPVSAFIFGLIAARLSAIGGVALVALSAAHVVLGDKIRL